MKLGIFGGTFNPPHMGHLIVAEHVRTELNLDRILFLPAAIPPHKLTDEIISANHRVAMLRCALEGNEHFEISDIEIERGGLSYTVDTLRQLKQRGEDELFLLIGMDNLLEFHTWKSPEKILQLATVVVMTRPGFDSENVPPKMKDHVTICPVPEIGIASREIRLRVRDGQTVRYLVSDSVAEYIRQHKLYVPNVSA
jgi:nicotinate-nucleotide adenylyltransferase